MFGMTVTFAQNRLPLSRFPDAPATINSRADISRVGARIIDELVRAMRDIDLDDVELACVKALVFFDPSRFLFQKVIFVFPRVPEIIE